MARKINESRRRFLKQSGTAAAAGLGSFLIPRFAKAEKKKRLRILQWNHFVPQFDRWFKDDFIRKWGDEHDTEVIIDTVGMTSLKGGAEAEVKAGKGHDLLMFLRPPPMYEDYVIDHREVYEECERRYGAPSDIALKSTYNPKTKKIFGFSDSYVPDLKTLVHHDAIATPSDKYAMLADVPDWATAVGYPGYANAVIDETFSSWVISSMFAEAARGRMKPEDAVKTAHGKVLDIYGKWQQRGKIQANKPAREQGYDAR
ncbi:MAG: twin-arginine translocation signal domain-containing protein [Gammaproteobacteria bacterium]|nr:twin-arginine translocation signal domain-containing protein [Gammaproteobacteria bacterium]